VFDPGLTDNGVYAGIVIVVVFWLGVYMSARGGTGGQEAQDALVRHLESRVPYGMHCTIERMALSEALFLEKYAEVAR
jgi:hypothetical protein